MIANIFRCAALGIMPIILLTPALSQTTYSVIDLGTLGGNTSSALGINDSGWVVGVSRNQASQPRAFLYSRGRMDTIPGLGSVNSSASGINNAGQIVGNNQMPQAFLFNNGQLILLGGFGGLPSWAASINGSGVVVGYGWYGGPSTYHGFVWNGTFTDLGTLPSPGCSPTTRQSWAYDVNNQGTIVGSSVAYCDVFGPGAIHGVRWQGTSIEDIGNQGQFEHDNRATSINNFGTVVGWGTATGPPKALIWTNGIPSPVSPMLPYPNWAWGLNDDGIIVGSYSLSDERACRWIGGIFRDLNDMIDDTCSWTLIRAQSINNEGQIVGYGSHNSETRAFLLQPGEVKVRFFNRILGIRQFETPNALTQDCNDPVKICADGSNSTLITIKTSPDLNTSAVRVRVAEDPQMTDPVMYGSFTYLNQGQFQDSLQVIYTHPSIVPIDSIKNRITLEIFNSVAPLQVVKQVDIEIIRAPVLLIHGIWSGPGAFARMQEAIDTTFWPPAVLPNTLTHKLDYSWSNAVSFSENHRQVERGINVLITKIRNAGYSAGKADVVAHSMGGILARLYLQSPSYQRNIRRLITLNTPHSGTQGANLILDPNHPSIRTILSIGSKAAFSPRDLDGGAVNDLMVNSPAILNDLNGQGHLNANIVPSLAMRTHASWADGTLPEKVIVSVSQMILGLSSVQEVLDALYHFDYNDIIVPDSSQRGGLVATQVVNGQSHDGAAKHPTVIAIVKELLRSDGGQFSLSGFDPPELGYTITAAGTIAKGLSSSKPATGQVTIMSPPNGSTVNAGDTIQVSVIGSQNIVGILLAGNVFAERRNGNSAVFDCVVPNDAIGAIKVAAAGVTDSNDIAIDSIGLHASVRAALTGIGTYSASAWLLRGDSVRVSVFGTYEDLVQRNLTGQPGLMLSSSNSAIVRITASGFVEGVDTGTATVTITYQSRSTIVNAEVLPIDAWTTEVGDEGGQESDHTISDDFGLLQNYPNPFNPRTTIDFHLHKSSFAVLKVFDILGRELATLVSQHLNPGNHSVILESDRWSTGVYFYRLQVGNRSETRKLVLLR